jgi:type 1 glutamine amidotransferase
LAQKYGSRKASRLISGDLLEGEQNVDWPIDQSDGGCACTPHCKHGSPWRQQIDLLDIADGDVISDSGSEIAGLFWDTGIDNVILMGVHTNMCVIGRSFGLRNMVRLGFNVALMRDLTDTMYNPESWPYVSHFSGTSLVVEHIEKLVCPTLLSTGLTGAKQFRFSGDPRPLVAFVSAEGEYRSDECLPEFAHELILKQGMNCEFAMGAGQREGPGRHNIENLQILQDADLAVMAIRRRALPAEKMAMIRDYVGRGKPVLGIRTASHAFDAGKEVPFSESGLPDPPGDHHQILSQWPDFDRQILGGHYQGHYRSVQEGHQVAIVPGMEQHPILKGFPEAGYYSPSWLYKNRPLQSGRASVLLVGTIPGKAPEPVLWTNDTGSNTVVYASMGHWDDWKIEAYRKLMTNSVLYLLDMHRLKPETR